MPRTTPEVTERPHQGQAMLKGSFAPQRGPAKPELRSIMVAEQASDVALDHGILQL